MTDLTECGIRAACVAAGLPGAGVVMIRSGSICAQVFVFGLMTYVYVDGRAEPNGWAAGRLAPLADVLTRMRAAALAEADRVLGRAP